LLSKMSKLLASMLNISIAYSLEETLRMYIGASISQINA
jgi:hypothetical protein